jgi:hypothetical protein
LEQRLELQLKNKKTCSHIPPVVELLELLEHALVEADGARPALGAVQHVSVGEAANKDDALEAVQLRTACAQVTNRLSQKLLVCYAT